MKLNITLCKDGLKVPCEIEFDFEVPEKATGYRGALGLIGMEVSKLDAVELLMEVCRHKIEKAIWTAWDFGYLSELKRIDL